ncbi:hypothetical protein GGR57DRAFT_456880 [Xylariaceae sp. FL1272]|nr:hypothetical protein GGR57DRAFT_456880 [Xylariaceae sp. FL1272]
MPPRKRVREQTEDISDEEVVILPRNNPTSIIPTTLSNIHSIKARRTKAREEVRKKHKTWVKEKKVQLQHSFKADVEQKKAKEKTLHERLSAAKAQRAQIEQEILKALEEADIEYKGALMFFYAAYSGKHDAAAKLLETLNPIPVRTPPEEKKPATKAKDQTMGQFLDLKAMNGPYDTSDHKGKGKVTVGRDHFARDRAYESERENRRAGNRSIWS